MDCLWTPRIVWGVRGDYSVPHTCLHPGTMVHSKEQAWSVVSKDLIWQYSHSYLQSLMQEYWTVHFHCHSHLRYQSLSQGEAHLLDATSMLWEIPPPPFDTASFQSNPWMCTCGPMINCAIDLWVENPHHWGIPQLVDRLNEVILGTDCQQETWDWWR